MTNNEELKTIRIMLMLLLIALCIITGILLK